MASSNGARSVDEPTEGEANIVDDVSARLDAFDAEHAVDGYDPVPTLQLYGTGRCARVFICTLAVYATHSNTPITIICAPTSTHSTTVTHRKRIRLALMVNF
jgi:hypothetical protein